MHTLCPRSAESRTCASAGPLYMCKLPQACCPAGERAAGRGGEGAWRWGPLLPQAAVADGGGLRALPRAGAARRRGGRAAMERGRGCAVPCQVLQRAAGHRAAAATGGAEGDACMGQQVRPVRTRSSGSVRCKALPAPAVTRLLRCAGNTWRGEQLWPPGMRRALCRSCCCWPRCWQSWWRLCAGALPRRAPLRMQCYDGAAQPLHGLGSRLAPGCHGTVAAAGC